MTITAWILFALIAFGIAFGVFIVGEAGDWSTAVTVIIAVVLIAAVFGGMWWYYHNTASGSRALIDQQADLRRGLDRVITVYTADGHEIARYEGKIDIESENSYVKFDFEGKRYIYYNCFVETIATLP